MQFWKPQYLTNNGKARLCLVSSGTIIGFLRLCPSKKERLSLLRGWVELY